MKVVDLDGRERYWNLQKNRKFKLKSQYHIDACQLIEELWPSVHYLEEVPIRVQQNKTLYLDIYIPLLRKAIEVQGKQHYQVNGKFHTTKFDLIKQRKNDILKEQWCILNDIKYIALSYDSKSQWKDLLR